jgi:hypothetical protein
MMKERLYIWGGSRKYIFVGPNPSEVVNEFVKKMRLRSDSYALEVTDYFLISGTLQRIVFQNNIDV